MLQFWILILFTPQHSNSLVGPCLIDNKPIRGVSYMPPMIGIAPQDISPYGPYYGPFYLRDLKLIKKLPFNTIRLRGPRAQLKPTDSEFFKTVANHGINVIATFTFVKYDLKKVLMYRNSQSTDDITRIIVKDFRTFVQSHLIYGKVVKAWCIGDVGDFVFESSELTPMLVGQMSNILDVLLEILNELDHDHRPKFVDIGMMADKTDQSRLEDTFNQLNGTNKGVDCWIINAGGGDDGNLQKLSIQQSLDFSSTIKVILEFGASAWPNIYGSTNSLENALQRQSSQMKIMLDFLEDGENGKYPGSRSLKSHIIEDWADQWWRGNCGGGYSHTPCGTLSVRSTKTAKVIVVNHMEYYGFFQQVDRMGHHCLSVRPSLQTYIKKYAPSSKYTADFLPDNLHCAYVYHPGLHSFGQDEIWILVTSTIFLFILIMVVCILCAQRKNKKIVHIRSSAALTEKLLQVDSAEEVKETYETYTSDNVPIFSKQFPEDVRHISLTKKKISKNPALEKRYMTFYLESHVKYQQANVDSMIHYEERIQQTLDSQNDAYARAINVVHHRLLEGYICWREKIGQPVKSTGDDPAAIAQKYFEIVLFRLLTSICEHILHCPERLSSCFDSFNQNENCNVDLDELQRGLNDVQNAKINFDDINDYGLINPKSDKPMRKTYREMNNLGVLFDIYRNYRGIIFLKGWIAATAYFINVTYNPLSQLQNMKMSEHYWLWVAIVDAILFFSGELLLFIVACRQEIRNRCRLPFALCFSFLCAVACPMLLQKKITQWVIPLYVIARVLFSVIISSYNGRIVGKGQVHGRSKKFGHSSQGFLSKIVGQKPGQTLFFWSIVLVGTLLVETYFVVDMFGTFPFFSSCIVQCSPSITANSLCMSCRVTIVVFFLLVGLIVCFDTSLLFVVVVSLFGYVKGQGRQIQDVYHSELCKVDLKRMGRERVYLEMLFGGESRAKAMWMGIVNDLNKRDSVSHEDAKMLKDWGKHWDFSEINPEARYRLSFFLNTLRTLCKQWINLEERPPISESIFANAPTLSHIITCYREKIFLSLGELRNKNGNMTNLEHLITLDYQKEWLYFNERFQREHNLPPDYDCLYEFLWGDNNEELDNILAEEVKIWASTRTQTVYRTIRGALTYHRMLKERLKIDSTDSDIETGIQIKTLLEEKDTVEQKDLKLEELSELIIANQTHGSFPNPISSKAAIDGWIARRADMNFVMEKFKNFSCLLVYDWAFPNHEIEKDVAREGSEYWLRVLKPVWEEDKNEMKEYLKQRLGVTDENIINYCFNQLKHASCVKRWVDDGQGGKLTLVAVMPRTYGMLLGKGENRTQGKSANQMNALRCVSGHVIQVSDANMDAWLGESYKVPFVTRMILNGRLSNVVQKIMNEPHHDNNRKEAQYRIIGFREYIFTERLGVVPHSMASSEFAFGTIFQRVLSDPLDARMHYGHPDFFDAFWVLNRGSLSKGSPRINLSEDIFSGYNVWLRNEKITHVDLIEWQKGREEVFTSSSGFLTKISSGAVAMLRSRDMNRMQNIVNAQQKLSLYFGGVGSFLLHVFIDYSIFVYVLFFALTALSDITLSDLGLASSSLASEWVISFGMVTIFPLLIELILEYGWGVGVMKMLTWLPGASMFFLFQNKAMAEAVKDGIVTGQAAYVETGRPSAFDHYSAKDAYILYAKSHYIPAFELLFLMWIYRSFNGESSGYLPMFVVMLAIFSWLFAPIFYCPQAGNWNLFSQDVNLTYRFFWTMYKKEERRRELRERSLNFGMNKVKSYRRRARQTTSLDTMWRFEQRNANALEIPVTRFVFLLYAIIRLVIIASICFSSFIDYALVNTVLLILHGGLCMLLKITDYSNIAQALFMLSPVLMFLILPHTGPFRIFGPECLMGTMAFLYGVDVARQVILGIAHLLTKCNRLSESHYYGTVDWMYFFSLSYHLHLYIGCFHVTAQFAVQLVLVFLSWIQEFFCKRDVIPNDGMEHLQRARVFQVHM